MGISKEFVKAGALLGKSIDLNLIYSQTADQMMMIIKGKDPAKLSITIPQKILLVLNLKTAKMIDFKVPSLALKQAGIIYK